MRMSRIKSHGSNTWNRKSMFGPNFQDEVKNRWDLRDSSRIQGYHLKRLNDQIIYHYLSITFIFLCIYVSAIELCGQAGLIDG